MIGLIGGTGLLNIPDVEVLKKLKIKTPYGSASDEFLLAQIRKLSPPLTLVMAQPSVQAPPSLKTYLLKNSV